MENAPSRARQVVREGDTLFSTVRPYLRNIALVPNRYDDEIASTGFSLLRPAEGICPAFLFYTVISRDFVNRVSKMQYGVSYPAVKDEQVREMDIRLPPSAEQYRIAAKIDELFSDIDNGIKFLKNAHAQLNDYRQTLLRYAFEGKLTEQWREENNDGLETPTQLLDRIKREQIDLYERKLRDWKSALAAWGRGGKSGRRPSKTSISEVTARIEEDELTDLPTLPQSWQYVRLSQIADVGSGMSVSGARKLSDPITIPYLSVANVQRGELDLSKVRTMRIERTQLPTLKLKRWDVLFCEGGDRDKLGRGWIWESQVQPCITQNHVFRASPFLVSHEHSKWISRWGNSFGKRYFELQGKQTTNLASINKTVLRKFPIPLPPIREQVEILHRIDTETTKLDSLARSITVNLRNASVLRQSILRKAFSGHLVPQDPSDEPVAVLLERINEREPTEKRLAPQETRRRRASGRQRGR